MLEKLGITESKIFSLGNVVQFLLSLITMSALAALAYADITSDAEANAKASQANTKALSSLQMTVKENSAQVTKLVTELPHLLREVQQQQKLDYYEILQAVKDTQRATRNTPAS